MFGPPGVGKTWAVRHVAATYHARLFLVDGARILGLVAGESEAHLRLVFRLAAERRWSVRELTQRKATLEDVFVELTHAE